MNRDEILRKVIEAIAETLDVEEADITEDTLFDDLDADSLDRLELMTTLEDEFDGTMDDDELMQIKSVGDVVDAIEKII